MKIVKELSGTVLAEGQEKFASSHVCSALHDEPVSGFLRHAELGAGGLILRVPRFVRVGDGPPVRDGDYEVGIPIDALWQLGESVEPGLKAPTAKAAKAIARAVGKKMK